MQRAVLHDLGLLFSILLLCCRGVFASEGDRNGHFHWCVTQCQSTGCAELYGSDLRKCGTVCSATMDSAVPLSLRLTRWNCVDDCKYVCMHLVEDHKFRIAKTPSRRPWKYYGKWPFQRVLGMQEPASVLFSLLNLVAHIHCLWLYVNVVQRRYIYFWIWLKYGASCCVAWMSSSLFHTRDTKLTELIDYGAASFTIFLGLCCTSIRTLSITKPNLFAVFHAASLLSWLCHYSYMVWVKFDYSYNMIVCMTAGTLQSLLWIFWYFRSQSAGRNTLIMFVFLVNVCMLFELLDFPPVAGIFDSHAIWHASTVPLTYLWYSFLLQDARVSVHAKAT